MFSFSTMKLKIQAGGAQWPSRGRQLNYNFYTTKFPRDSLILAETTGKLEYFNKII